MMKKYDIKKCICLLLCICMTAVFPSCQKITAFRLITTAFEKTAALDSFSGVMNMTAQTNLLNTDLEMPIHLQIKAEGLKSESPAYSGHYDTAVLGQRLESSFYSADGWNYHNDGFTKYKTKADLDKSFSGSTKILQSLKGSFSEELLKDVQITEDAEGLQTVQITLTGEQFKKSFRELAETVARNYGGDSITEETFDKLVFSDVAVGIGVDENHYIAKESLSFVIDMKLIGDFGSDLKIDLTMLYENPGQPVKADVPEDLDEYKEQPGFSFGEDEASGGFDWKEIFRRGEDESSGENSENSSDSEDAEGGFDWKKYFQKIWGTSGDTDHEDSSGAEFI